MSLATESMIIQKWIGAPYRYHGRDSVKGVDCVNLVVSILEDLTGDEIPLPRYQKDWERVDPDLFERSFYLYEDRFVEINESWLANMSLYTF